MLARSAGARNLGARFDFRGSDVISTGMARTFLESLRACVRRHAMIARGDTVLAAVSGGADSVAMLGGLLALREELDITVVAAHLDHGARGVESTRDRAFVEDLARTLHVPCLSDATTIPAGNFEAEARRVRYAFLERAADQLGATKIATGHTRDDQAETVLLRIVRGAGRRGLGGIRPRRGRVIRPLLECDRIQVRIFLVDRGLAWRRDYTNFDVGLERARVRHGFLPALARDLNPRLARTLADLADHMREEDALLDRLAGAAARGRSLATPVLVAIEPPLARRAIRIWWRRHGSGERLGRTHVEAIRTLAARASDDGEVAGPGGAIVREHGQLRFRSADIPLAAAETWELPLVAGVDLDTPGGWRLSLTAATPATVPPPDDATCLVDADRIGDAISVRNRRPGDRLRALGLGGHTSVKRLMSARRVSRHLRADHPVVVCDGEILWVPGCGRSQAALVGPTTNRCWIIRVIRSPNESA
jgi:tRNA(Ile)-lysidine synthase